MRRGLGAFTLIELLVVISIIMLLMALLFPIAAAVWKRSRETAARNTLRVMGMSMESYFNDFDAYPPDDLPGADSNESLAYYLTTRFKIGERYMGPYFVTNQQTGRDGDGDGLWELYSPIGGKYEYRQLHGVGGRPIYMIIDPSHDLKLGGTINPATGFVPDGSGADKDNITEKGQH